MGSHLPRAAKEEGSDGLLDVVSPKDVGRNLSKEL